MLLTKEQFDELYGIAACFANCEAIDETGNPATLSLAEIQSFGTQMLNLLDGETP